jgi:L-amino acid N-acyltransferase YncA
MPPRVRGATAADAAAQEMANRSVETLAMHEWLVLEEDGSITGYAYAHQFNSRAALPVLGPDDEVDPPRPIAT